MRVIRKHGGPDVDMRSLTMKALNCSDLKKQPTDETGTEKTSMEKEIMLRTSTCTEDTSVFEEDLSDSLTKKEEEVVEILAEMKRSADEERELEDMKLASLKAFRENMALIAQNHLSQSPIVHQQAAFAFPTRHQYRTPNQTDNSSFVQGGVAITLDQLRQFTTETSNSANPGAGPSNQSTGMGKSKKAKAAKKQKKQEEGEKKASGAANPSIATTSTNENAKLGTATGPKMKENDHPKPADTKPIEDGNIKKSSKGPIDIGSSEETTILHGKKDQIVVSPELLEMVTDIGIFAKMKKSEFEALDRNTLLTFIHLYARDQMPMASDSDEHVLKIFLEFVHKQQYWVSWVREAMLFCLRQPAVALLKPDDVTEIQKAVEDLDFLEWIAPEFKAKAVAAFVRRQEARANNPEDPRSEEDVALQAQMRQNVGVIDTTIGDEDGTKKKKKKKNKKKGKHNAAEHNQPLHSKAITSNSIDATEGQPRAIPLDMPQIRRINNFDDLMDVFVAARV
ncbi:hypothetical protein ABW20_dc0100381 [Dactylellina cionopaga]|nr:hypothetical protein ABW20_dc0100381 [Dactylellina cionopaga]